ncbi:MAG TPA: 3-hydroxyacyl-CoA dehydrogenase/enoyl-CoA hydratase family protein [Xanthobacteraceae bacterium]|nr:3-hydroxyacyl-CoA dehydrogenase/enoyl-CoA hydratase family protein [Xanthobacteraceae bacterium]
MSLQNPLVRRPSRALPRCVVVVGAGTIGPDIGYYLKSALPGLKLYLIDISQPALDRAMQRFTDYTNKAVQRGKMSANEAEQVRANAHATTDYDVAREADWAIEAATEDLTLKRKIFAQLEALMRPDAWITSNTSSLPAARIFSELRHKDRATVTHFFAPAWRNPVVEVIDTPALDRNVLEDLRALFCTTGKVPLVTADVPCFMLDRVFDNWCNEAAHLLDSATAAEIDTVATEFVHAGPFFVLNLAHGNPIIIETNTLQADEEGEHYRPAAVFRSVETWRTASPGKPVPVAKDTAAAIRDRLLGSLISQSGDILDRDIGAPQDLELGCRLGLGFKSGPLDLMGRLGAAEVSRIGERLAHERPGLPLPQRPLAAYQDFSRFVLVDDVRDVKIITIRRPEALNALHDELTDEILGVIRRFENDPAVCGFVLTGYGPRAFSAGADIGRFPKMLGDAEAAAQYARDCSRLLLHIDRMKKPVVAALNGMALGGGLELALRCHGIVAMRNAWLQLPEITLGIVPGLGAMVAPYRRWPKAAATFHAMMRSAERVSAKTAHELGMIDHLSDDYAAMIEAAIERVHVLQGRLQPPADGAVAIEPPAPSEAIAANGQKLSAEVTRILDKAIVEAAAAQNFNAALEIGYRAFGLSVCTAAAREGIDAFLARRAADFSKTG